jgi:pentapeptide MXKDX repeat protein
MTGSPAQGVSAPHLRSRPRLPKIRPPAPRPVQVQIWLVAALFVLAAVAWLVTGDRMEGMDAGPGTDPGALGFYVGVWVTMMAAMMFPSIAPMVIMYRRIHDRRRELGKARPGATGLFVAGYLIAWTGFGLFAYGLLEVIRSVSIDALSWNEGGRYLAGGVVVAAAVYQLTPLKDACLTKCRSPLAFVLGHWRNGYGGALRMGVAHGAWCVGCCWALMAALFALGVMSIGWMAFVAALIATEKLLPWKAIANRGIAVLLAVLGVAVAFVPGQVPGLTLPDSSAAHEAMMRMDGGGMEGDSMKRDQMKGDSMKDGSMKRDSKTGQPMKDERGAMPGGSSKNEPESMDGPMGGSMEGSMEGSPSR